MPGNACDIVVDELPNVLPFLDIDLQKQVVIAARRIHLRDDLLAINLVGHLIGLAGSALHLHENRFHGGFLKFASLAADAFRLLP